MNNKQLKKRVIQTLADYPNAFCPADVLSILLREEEDAESVDKPRKIPKFFHVSKVVRACRDLANERKLRWFTSDIGTMYYHPDNTEGLGRPMSFRKIRVVSLHPDYQPDYNKFLELR